jgi:hypothetical protein
MKDTEEKNFLSFQEFVKAIAKIEKDHDAEELDYYVNFKPLK